MYFSCTQSGTTYDLLSKNVVKKTIKFKNLKKKISFMKTINSPLTLSNLKISFIEDEF